MEFSRLLDSSLYTSLSPCGTLLAVVNPPTSSIIILSLPSLRQHADIPLSTSLTPQITALRWSPLTVSDSSSQWLLVAFADRIQVYNPPDVEAKFNINLPTPSPQSILFSPNASFILIFSPLSLTLTICHLSTSLTTTIRDPKAVNSHSFRPSTAHLAVLTRPSAHDVLSIHDPATFTLLSSTTLPTTDAQGVKWSPCGQWLAVHDAAGAGGYRVVILTPDAQVFRTFEGTAEAGGLGVKTVEWGGEYLAVGDYERKVTLLNNRTFSPALILAHPSVITHTTSTPIYEEIITPSGAHAYDHPTQPTISLPLPTNAKKDSSQCGISILAFSPDSSLLATRDDAHPSTIWIWDLGVPGKGKLVAVLVQRSEIRKVEWGEDGGESVLMVQCETREDEAVRLYLWSREEQARAVEVRGLRATGGGGAGGGAGGGGRKVKFAWLGGRGRRCRLLADDTEHFVLGHLGGEDAEANVEVPVGEYEPMFDSSGMGGPEADVRVEDTFQFKGQRRVGA